MFFVIFAFFRATFNHPASALKFYNHSVKRGPMCICARRASRYRAKDGRRGAGACHALLRKKWKTAVTWLRTQAGGKLTLAERRQTASEQRWVETQNFSRRPKRPNLSRVFGARRFVTLRVSITGGWFFAACLTYVGEIKRIHRKYETE